MFKMRTHVIFILSLVIIVMKFPEVVYSVSHGTIKGYRDHAIIENMESQGTSLVVMTVGNLQQCLRLCWLYSDCTILTFYPHDFMCRLVTDSPGDINATLVSNDKAVTVDMRQASVFKPRLYGCDRRPCAPHELCTPVIDKDTCMCLPLGYQMCPSSPPAVPNCVQTMDGLSKVTYTCEEGYEQTGSNDVTTCDSAIGLWSDIDVKCTLVDCGSPSNVDGAITRVISTFYNANVTYTCYDGYVSPSPKMEITCQANNQWTASPLPCTLTNCGSPVGVSNGSVSVLERSLVNAPPGMSETGLQLSYGGTAVHVCNEGFESPTPTFRSECQADGTWESTSSFTCSPVDCGQPPAIANTWSSFNLTTFPSRVAYMCVEGYENATDSAMEATCLANGNWSGLKLTCVEVDCGKPAHEPNAIRVFNATTYLYKAKYTCISPAIMHQRDVQSRVCQADGKWSEEDVPCIRCGTPPNFDHSSFNITRKPITLYVAEYRCDEGFSLTGGEYKECRGRSWEGPDPICSPISCGKPPEVSHASILTNGTTFNAVALYSCDNEFVPVYNNATTKLVCGSDGWMDKGAKSSMVTLNLLECRRIECGTPPDVDNSIVQVLVSGPQIANYTCLPGYSLTSDSSTKLCTSDGWENTNVTCEKMDCGTPKDLENTTWAFDDGVNVTRVAVYTCVEGHAQGQYRVECVQGKWTNYEAVSCPSVDCGTTPFVRNVRERQFQVKSYIQHVFIGCMNGRNWTMICQSNGTWSNAGNTCQDDIDCGPPPSFPDTTPMYYVSVSGMIEITYECQPGYVINRTISSTKLTCVSGTWRGEIATALKICDVIDCQSPPVVPNAVSRYNTTTANSTVWYQCHDGYVPSSYNHQTCNESEAWSMNQTTYGSNASITICRSVCLASGNWSQVDMTCQLYGCEEPPTIEGGKLTLARVHAGTGSKMTTWLVECHPSFQYLGETSRTVNCSIDDDSYMEQWVGNDTMEACVPSKWTNAPPDFMAKLAYHRQHYFNSISVCLSGPYEEKPTGLKGMAFRYKQENDTDNFLAPMRLMVYSLKSEASLQYTLGPGAANRYIVRTDRVNAKNGQYLTVCCNYFRFNATFTAFINDEFFGKITYPVAGNSETVGFGDDWAKYFYTRRENMKLEFVNITYMNYDG